MQGAGEEETPLTQEAGLVGAVDSPIGVDLEMEADAHPAVEAAGPAPGGAPLEAAAVRAAALNSPRGGRVRGRRVRSRAPLSRAAAAAAASAAVFGTERRRASDLRAGGPPRPRVCPSEEDQVAEEEEAEEAGQAHASSPGEARGILQRRRRLLLLRPGGAGPSARPAWGGIVGPPEGERAPRAQRWHGDIYNPGDLTCLESKGGSLRQPSGGCGGRLAG